MSYVPYALLIVALAVRVMLARRMRIGWVLDLATVPLWTLFYIHTGAYPLLVLTYIFGALDIKALVWWRK